MSGSATAVRPAPLPLRWLASGWEEWLTFALALGMAIGVTFSIEQSEITEQMPALYQVGALGLLAGMLLALSGLRAYLGWPLGAALGAAACFWQTMETVEGSNAAQRIDSIYFRFQTWFRIAFDGGVSNDPLPFIVLLVGMTWLGVFLSGWALFRWHNAWLGVIAGGTAIFVNQAATGTGVSAGVFLYALASLLLLMRAHLTLQLRSWRRDDIGYPPLLSLSYLHLTTWAVALVLMFAWLLPAGGRPAVGFWDNLVEQSSGAFTDFVRLAGPLKASKITPIHDYTTVFPFDGSIKLRERQLLTVKVEDPGYTERILLRGTTYDRYSAGGWEVSDRVDVPLSPVVAERLREDLEQGDISGRLLPLTITVDAKSVVGTVVFSPGQLVTANIAAKARLSRESIFVVPFDARRDQSDEEILTQLLPEDYPGIAVERDASGRARSILVLSDSGMPLPDATGVQPQQKVLKGQSYRVVGFIPDIAGNDLRTADSDYPNWVSKRYLQLPDSLPLRVRSLAADIVQQSANPYDSAKAIETYLRTIPINYKIGNTPPGRDTVDYFLFEARQGYFNYHASSMVVMMRSLGIPARLAVGFVIDSQTPANEDGSFTVRDKNAYAWPEVYFPGYGWIEFNPAPDRVPFSLLGENGAAGSSGGQGSLLDSFGSPDLSGLEELLPDQSLPSAQAPVSLRPAGNARTPLLLLAIAGLFSLAAVLAGTAIWWQASVAALPYPQQTWQKTMRLASWAGYRSNSGQTPGEFAAQLGRTIGYREDMALLARLYNRSYFGRSRSGHPELSQYDKAQLRYAWRNVRRALIWEVARLKEPRLSGERFYNPWA